MPVFDALGREWQVALDAPKSQRVREECGVNLTPRPGEKFELAPIVEDPERLPNVLWVLVRSQAEKANVTRDAFVEAIVGDVAEAAGVALGEAIVNFIPNRGRREALREALKLDREALAAGMELTATKVRELGPRQREAVLAAVDRVFAEQTTLLLSATGSPASSESPPKEEPGANSSGCATDSSARSDAT